MVIVSQGVSQFFFGGPAEVNGSDWAEGDGGKEEPEFLWGHCLSAPYSAAGRLQGSSGHGPPDTLLPTSDGTGSFLPCVASCLQRRY